MSNDPANESESKPLSNEIQPKSGRPRFHIPEPKLPSPEQQEKYEQRRLEQIKRAQRNRRIRIFVASLVFLTVPVLLVWYFNVAKRGVESRENVPTKSLDDFDKLVESGSAGKLMQYSDSLDQAVATRVVPQQLAAFQKKLRIADELIRREADAESVRFGVLTKINSLAALASFDRTFEQTSDQFCSELLTFCEQYSRDDDPKIRNLANIGQFTAAIHYYLLNPTEEQFAVIESKVDAFVLALAVNEDTTGIVPSLASLVARSGNDSHFRSFSLRLAKGLTGRDEPVLRNIGDDITGRTLFGKVNFEEMRRLIQIPDQQTIERLQNLVAAIAEYPNANVAIYSGTLAAVESLPATQRALRDQLREKLQESAQKITNPDLQQQVSDRLAGYDAREKLVGKFFELGSEITGDPAQQTAIPTVILFIASTHKPSIDWLVLLEVLAEGHPLENRYVVVCIDEQLSGEFRQQMKQGFPAAIVIGPAEKEKYLQQCPIATVPYMIILDKEQQVVAADVDIDGVRVVLEKLPK